jgi:PPM family protein phosphatase
MQFKVGIGTDIGRKRSQNQDSAVSQPELGLFVVADGMGGHRGGEIASAMAVDVIPQIVRKRQKSSNWDPVETATDAITSANYAIYAHAMDQTQLQGMGTTTTALLFRGDLLTIGHVGDSRCYYLRPNALWQATRDHSLVQEKLRAGLINRDQLKTDRMKNVITRSVGFEPEVNVEIYQMSVQAGDLFLICSDGLSGLVDDPEILTVVQKECFEGNNIQGAVDALVAAANRNGGDDNITTILVQVMETHG